MEYRKDIQGLRAIAVISVWLFHLNHNILPGGFIGVDIFFVISGFLISSIILHQKENKNFSFRNFYVSRIKRIIPAYYIFLILISIAVLFVYLPSDIAFNYRPKLLHSFIFNSNNYFATLNNYFGAASSENPLLHTWTLAIEMQFYFFLPILVFLFNRKKCLYICIGFSILFYLYAQYQISVAGNQNLMYFSLLARAPEFLLGVLLSLIQWQNNIKVKNQSVLGIIGLLLIILSTIFINSETTFPGLITLIPCGGVILILMNKEGIVNKALSNKILVYIGELSYSIYLWHWGILALIRYKYVEYTLTIDQYLLAITLTLALSYLSYRFIEGHFKKYSLTKFIIRFSIIPIIIICLAFSMKNISKYLYNTDFPSDLTATEAIGLDNHNHFIKDVIQGDIQSKDTLLLLGNSHGLVLKPFLEYTGKANGFCFRSITNDSYPTIPGFNETFFSNKSEYNKYNALIDIVKEKIASSPIIIIGTTFKEGKESEYITALEYLITRLLTENQHIIIMSDFPTLDRNPIRINRSVLKSKSKQTQFTLEYQKLPEDIKDYIETKNNIHFLDISDSQAFNEAPFYNDTVMYYDNLHINKYGSTIYAQFSGLKLAELAKRLLENK